MGMKNSKKPAIQAYSELQQAYDFFNATLFEQMLPGYVDYASAW